MVLPESGKTHTPWLNTKRLEFAKLEQDAQCEVLVIGAGVTGLMCAYKLAKEGKKIIVVDSGRMCSGETQRTTAHLCDQIDDTYTEIDRVFGADDSKLIRESLTASIDLIEQIVADEKIDCDFERVPGYLFLSENAHDFDLQKEKDLGLKAGLRAVENITILDCVTGGPAALKYPDQAQIHSVKFLNGLCTALKKIGVEIFQESRVVKVDKKGPQATLKNDVKISATDIIIATNGPIIDFSIQTKQVAYRSYVVGIRVIKDAIPRALFWDTEDPYHYARLHSIDETEEEELFIVGGEDHRVGEKDDAEDRFEKLVNWAKEKFGANGLVEYKWSGQVYEPTDMLGFIGQDPELGKHIYVATGDSGMGITNGAVASMLLTDLIMHRENAWQKIYSLSRQTLKALPDYIVESTHSVAHYAELLVPGKKIDADDIKNDSGRLVEEGGKKVAAYRDKDGALSKVSPYCTHLKGVVCWNSCESSWDCPVHGSRFMGTGEVIYGPADGDLAHVKE